jgi:phospholipid transport system substrate-binding protein
MMQDAFEDWALWGATEQAHGQPQLRDESGMTTIASILRGPLAPGSQPGSRAARWVAGAFALALIALAAGLAAPARAADPAVVFMAQVGRELTAAARTRSPGVMANVIQRYGDVTYIGLYSLGAYRARLAQTERPGYFAGTVRFISRYAAGEASKYQVARVEWANQSTRGSGGIMVDSRVVLTDGTAYDVRWLVAKVGSTYRVRDAMVLGFWMTPFLKKLFEDYIAQNGGNPQSLTTALNR